MATPGRTEKTKSTSATILPVAGPNSDVLNIEVSASTNRFEKQRVIVENRICFRHGEYEPYR
jgi:hypothetical protein